MANEDSEWKNILKFGGSNKRSRDDEEESPNQRARKNLRVSNSNDQKASNSNKDKRDFAKRLQFTVCVQVSKNVPS